MLGEPLLQIGCRAGEDNSGQRVGDRNTCRAHFGGKQLREERGQDRPRQREEQEHDRHSRREPDSTLLGQKVHRVRQHADAYTEDEEVTPPANSVGQRAGEGERNHAHCQRRDAGPQRLRRVDAQGLYCPRCTCNPPRVIER